MHRFFRIKRMVEVILEKQLSVMHRLEDLNWNFMRILFGRLWPCPSKVFWRTFFFVVEMFDRYKCSSYDVISDILQMGCYLCEYEPDYRLTHLIFCMRNCPLVVRYSFPHHVPILMKIPYRDVDFVHYEPNEVRIVMKSGLPVLLKVLLRYGVMYSPRLDDTVPSWSEISLFLACTLNKVDEEDIVSESCFLRNIGQLCHTHRRRMLIVYEGVEVILKLLNFNVHEAGVRCLRMVFDSIPEPFITSHEIRNFLQLALTDPFDDRMLNEICKAYEEHFPEGLAPRGPRPLQHLSRCQIRQILRQCSSLPHKVDLLEIPKRLKDYILLETS